MRGAKARRFEGGARGETALGVCPRPGLRGEARRRARTGVVQVVHLVQRLHQPRGVAHELVALLCAAARQQAKDTGLSAFGLNTAQRRRICAPAPRSARAACLWRCESARGTSRAASGARRGSAPSPWLLPAARLHAAPLRHRPANRHESRRLSVVERVRTVAARAEWRCAVLREARQTRAPPPDALRPARTAA